MSAMQAGFCRGVQITTEGGAGMSPDRECGCPPIVEQCVHFDGRWLILHLNTLHEWMVCRGSGPQAWRDKSHDGADGHWGWHFLDRADALRAFTARAARMVAEVPA